MKRSVLVVAALTLGGCISNHQVGDNGRPTGQTGGTGGGTMVDAGPITDASLGSGGSGGIGSDASPEGCNPYTPPPPNSAECPPTWVVSGTSCAGLATTLNCSYAMSHSSVETCGCYHVSTSSDQKWLCNGAGSGGPSAQCPDPPPIPGADCSGLIGESCLYLPGYQFVCVAPGYWLCNPPQVLPLPTPLSPRPAPPPGVDESKQVQQLTMAEAQAWCQWYVGDWMFQTGQAPPDDNGQCPGMPGYVCGYAGISAGGGLPYLSGCLERIPLSACVANLMLRPCDATVHDLDDCVMSFWAGAQGHYVGNGCFPYQTHAICNETVVQLNWDPMNPGPQSCAIPIQ